MKLLLLLALIFVLANSECVVGDGETVGQFSTLVVKTTATACAGCSKCEWDATLTTPQAKCTTCSTGYFEVPGAAGLPKTCSACGANALTCTSATAATTCLSGFYGASCTACTTGFATCKAADLWLLTATFDVDVTCATGYGIATFSVTDNTVRRNLAATPTEWKSCKACFDLHGVCTFTASHTLTVSPVSAATLANVSAAAALAGTTWTPALGGCVDDWVYIDAATDICVEAVGVLEDQFDGTTTSNWNTSQGSPTSALCCQEGFFLKTTPADGQNPCLPCPAGHKVCEHGSDAAPTCETDTGTCCLSGYVLNTDTDLCVACPVGSTACTWAAGVITPTTCDDGYSPTGTCTSCGEGVLTCSGAAAPFTITECLPGYFYKAGATATTGACISVTDEVCTDCPEGCSECEEDGEICTGCIDGYDLGEDDTCEEEDDGGDGGDDTSSSSLLKPIIYLSMILALILFY